MRTYNFDFVRLVAILLVTNSHFDALYPDPRMGTGGALGNAMFFALSGYGLAHSFRRGSTVFHAWYLRRASRIYPSVWIVAIVTLAWLVWRGEANQLTALEEFIWPTRHWFVSAIMLFYLPVYALLTLQQSRVFLHAAMLLAIPYLVWYVGYLDLSVWSIEGGYFKWLYYLQVMFLGCWLAGNESLLRATSAGREAAILGLLVAGYFGMKLGLPASGLWSLQFLLHLITLPIILFSLRTVATLSFQKWMVDSRLGKMSLALAAVSFEIYLTQHLFHQSHWLRSLPFPLGALLALGGTVTAAVLVSRAAERLRALIGFIGVRASRSVL